MQLRNPDLHCTLRKNDPTRRFCVSVSTSGIQVRNSRVTLATQTHRHLLWCLDITRSFGRSCSCPIRSIDSVDPATHLVIHLSFSTPNPLPCASIIKTLQLPIPNLLHYSICSTSPWPYKYFVNTSANTSRS